MTGFLLTAKQKLMLCINKRLYWADRTNRSYRTCGRYRNLRMCSADEKYPSADHTTLRNR